MTAKRDLDLLFQDLYRQYYRAVVRRFTRGGSSREDARDLAQDTFVRVYQGMKKGYRGEARWGYIMETAKHVGLNKIRSRRAQKRHAEIISLETLEHLPDVAQLDPMTGRRRASPVEEALEQEEKRLLCEALENFGPQDRLLVLLWLQGRTYEEITIAMQITMDTVKTRLKRLKRRLKRIARETPGFGARPVTSAE